MDTLESFSSGKKGVALKNNLLNGKRKSETVRDRDFGNPVKVLC